MKGGYFIIKGEHCYPEVLQLLEVNYGKHFKSEIADGHIYFVEEYSFMNASELMTVIRLQKISGSDHSCEIEVISGGGAKGMFSITYGNEVRRVNKALKLVTGFCLSKGFEYSTIAYKKKG